MAIKSINIYDKPKRLQLANELCSLNSASMCHFLIHFYGAYYDEGSVKIALEYMDFGSLRTLIDVHNRHA